MTVVVISAFMLGKAIGRGRIATTSAGAQASVPPDPQGKVDVCLQSKPPRSLVREGRVSLTIQGQLVALGPTQDSQGQASTVVDCDESPQWYFDVVDSNYGLWRVLYTLSDLDAGRVKVQTGTNVTVKFRALIGFSKAAGFVLSDRAGILLAVEDGAFGEGLVAADELPFSIRKADALPRLDQGGCGDAVLFALNVFADTKVVRVLPGRTAAVALGGAAYRFWNACSYSWVNQRCTDMLGDTSWVLWRE